LDLEDTKMRKLLLISALLLASGAAHAGPSSGMELAAADTPAATATDTAQPPTAQPLPPVTDSAKDGTKDSAKDSSKDSSKPQATDASRPHAAKQRSHARRYEGDEAKARRIAAKYGISW
jgi:hypothetical protein